MISNRTYSIKNIIKVSEKKGVQLLRYYCPRCGCKDIIEYDKSFDCPLCKDDKGMPLEFDKEDFNSIDDKSNILSVQEKLAFIKESDVNKSQKKQF